MSVNLAASQSAIAHDITSNTTHVVWANNGNIWHAVFDENSETWINAEPIAFAGTAPITGLNLVTSEKLIDGKNPGIAVVWQQGKLNSSDFYYTAAQYDQNLNLQWLPSSQALTSDQVGDLQPTVTVNNIGEVIVFGTKVNLVNAANWAISEDTDLYYQQFTVSSSQFTSTADDVAGQATYSPQLGQNGIVNMGVFANNTQTSVPSTQPSTGRCGCYGSIRCHSGKPGKNQNPSRCPNRYGGLDCLFATPRYRHKIENTPKNSFKMIKDVARAIPGVEIYPIISLSIFFLFFTVLSLYVVRSKKEKMDELRRLPLEE